MSPPRIGAPLIPRANIACPCHGVHPSGSGVGPPRKISTSASVVINRLTAASDQASLEAAWPLISPALPHRAWLLSSLVARQLSFYVRHLAVTAVPREPQRERLSSVHGSHPFAPFQDERVAQCQPQEAERDASPS